MGFESGSEFPTKKLFTGLGDCNVLLVNPTLAELNAAGLNYKEEPNYLSEAEGVNKVRLDIYVDNPTVGIQKVAFFIADESKESNDYDFNDCFWKRIYNLENFLDSFIN